MQINNTNAFDINNLNKEQREAVTAADGSILVLAGAGSGKTRVLVSRCAYLISEENISPGSILAVTFTNKAAREMRTRLENMTGNNTGHMWLGTFHSICLRILRIESQHRGYDGNFIIYDDNDTQSLLKKIIAQMELDDKKYAPRAVAVFISDAKNNLRNAGEMTNMAANDWERKAAEIYSRYQKTLKDNNALDFDDLIVETVRLFQGSPEVLEKYRTRFKYVLVDEYQDINHMQYMFVSMLAGNGGNIFVVGDPDQSIYGWRGADMNNILDFEKDFPDCRIFTLTQNYRSTQNILDAANKVINNNALRKPKDLWSDKSGGDKIILHTVDNDRDEAYYVLQKAKDLLLQGFNYNNMAVLCRTNSQTRSFEDACVKNRVPYRVIGSMKFYERKEIKDILAFLRVVSNPADSLSLSRIYDEPRRGMGKKTWDKLEESAFQRGVSLYWLLGSPEEIPALSAAAGVKLKKFHEFFESMCDFAALNTSLAALMQKIWDDSGYMRMLKEDPDGEPRIENLSELYNLAVDFDRQYAEDELEAGETPLSAFLSRVALATDLDDYSGEEDYLTLMTLHAAKGLEFPVVFMIAMEENFFPHPRSLTDDSELEEERRLCYVGMTRAKEKLIFTRAMRRLSWGRINENPPSRFLREVPSELLQETGISYKKTTANKDNGYRSSSSIFTGAQPGQLSAKNDIASELVSVGDKIQHAKFGIGIIVSSSGTGESLEVGVAFPDMGIKTLIWRYAPVKRISK